MSGVIFSVLLQLPVPQQCDQVAFAVLSAIPSPSAEALDCLDPIDIDCDPQPDEYIPAPGSYGSGSPVVCCWNLAPVGPTMPGVCIRATTCTGPKRVNLEYQLGDLRVPRVVVRLPLGQAAASQ